MTSFTKLRLKESLFFLQKMETNIKIDPDFDYYLNAFIGLARSVKWIMNNEYSKIEGWKEWFDKIPFTVEEDAVLNKIAKYRNISVKERPLTTSYEYYVPIPEEFNVKPGEKYRFIISKTNLKSNEENEKIETEEYGPKLFEFIGQIESGRILEESEDYSEDIMKLCHDYYRWLEDLIHEVENRFKCN